MRTSRFTGAWRPIKMQNGWIGVALVSGALVASSIWFIFVSGYWRVSRVDVYGVPDEERGVVSDMVYKVLDEGTYKPWDKRNIFFIDTTSVAAEVQDRLFAEHVSVEKSYPNILRLMVTERQRSVVLISKGQQLMVDTQGVVTGETDERIGAYVSLILARKTMPDITRLPIIVADLPDPAGAGYQASDEEHVKRWITAYRALLGARVRFRFMGFDSLENSLARLKAEDGTDIIVDLALPLDPQIDTYQKFMQNKKRDTVIQEYVDVRVPGKIYVK